MDKPTILHAVRDAAETKDVVPTAAVNILAACASAETSDVVLACLGEKAYSETPGNIVTT